MKLPRKVYREAQIMGVQFAHEFTADFPPASEAKNKEEERLRRVMFLKGWGCAQAGFKAGYYAGYRATRKK